MKKIITLVSSAVKLLNPVRFIHSYILCCKPNRVFHSSFFSLYSSPNRANRGSFRSVSRERSRKADRFTTTVFFFLFSSSYLFAQPWVDKMQDPASNFYDIQQSFEQHWQGKTIEKGKGWKQFKRWEWFMQPRVYPTGDRTVLLQAAANYKAYHDSLKLLKAPPAGNWTFLGPSTVPSSGGGAGRVNCIRFDPANTNIIWAGTPCGGLWKSTNGGTSWTTNTDQLTVLGVTDVAIDPTNNNIMYIATGDGDAGDTYSIGVLKSTDGGATWNTTGLSWTVNQTRRISRLLINPTNTNILLAATSNGVYRSSDAGATWAQTLTGSRKDMEFKPGDPNTVYTCGTTFYKSTNGGTSFTQVTSGVPTSVNRLAIAVTAANPAYVYLLAGKSSDSGFQGMYRSTNSGTSFSTRSTTPNTLGWNCGGTDSGGQSWYDLAVAASPTNADVVIIGGVNIWRSVNGGTSWSMNAHWYGGCSVPYVHADQHDLVFLPGSGTTYFSGNDGGVFKTTNSGSGWTDLSSNLQIAQMYRLGLSATNANISLSGWQDNGTNRSNPSWSQEIGGDGMECIVDYTSSSIMYGELYYGEILKSTNGGNSFPTTIVQSGGTGVNANGSWVTPYIMHPTTNTTLLVGKAQVYRSTNSGTNWSQVGTVSGGTGSIISLAYAPSNGNYIYAAKTNRLWVSTNGTSFTDRTGTLPVSSASITYIAVSNTDPSKAWVTFSGYSSGNKVYYTANAGVSWTNYSTGLPNLPANCIVYQNGTSDGLYVGTDVGAYYRDNSYTSWQSFSTGLPNVIVNELEIHYGSGKIRAATYGRGMWESGLLSAGNFPPIADFTATPTSGCTGTSIQFTDQSSLTPTSWQWAFSGGTPATSTSQNPAITYNATGNYDVILIACNANGCDTITKTQYINITGVQNLPLTEGFQSLPFLPANWFLYNPDNDNTWQRSTTIGGYGTSNACSYFNNYSIDVTGTRDAMWTPKYDFTGLSSATLTFDVAYARYDATYSDSLAVYVSTDCGATFTQVYLKGGTGLATAPDNTSSNFVPTNSQWRTETVSLNSFVGQSKVMLAFENRSWYGQYLFVDNINITGVNNAPPTAAFTANTTTLCAGGTVNFTDQSTGNPTSWSWTFQGGTPATSTQQNPTVTYATAGTFAVTLVATNSNGSDTETQSGYVTVDAIPVVTVSPASPAICEGSSTSLTASGASAYSWSPATGLSGTTGATVTANSSSTTTYIVTGTQNSCVDTQSVTVTVNALPIVSVSPASPAVCAGSSSSLTASGASTYSWSPATGLSGTTGATVTANPSSTTTYIVTGTQSGCSDTQSVTVTVNALPVITISPASPAICEGSSTSLTASGATTYSWSPATGLSGTTGATVTANPLSTTTYIVSGTQNGCNGSNSVTVTVNAIPTVSVTPPSPSICSGNSITLFANGATSYSWSPASGLSDTVGASVTANPASTATYTLSGTTNGCTGTANVTVTVTSAPVVTVNPTSPSICTSGSTILNASGATTYAWSPATGLSDTTGASVTANPSSTTTYNVTGTVSGCTSTSSANVTVTVSNAPAISVSPSSGTICSNETITLTASGANGFNWSPAAGLSATTGISVNANPSSNTTYTVTETESGCGSATTVTINVNNAPSVNVSASSSTICSGDSATLTASGTTSYSWFPSGGLNTTSGNSVIASPVSPTTYSVVGTQGGCNDTATISINVNPAPVISLASSTNTICSGDSAILSASGADTYSWSPSAGLSAATGDSVMASPSSNSTYSVSGTLNGCASSTPATITVNVIQTLPISVTPINPTVCPGGSVTLTASGASDFNWSPTTGLDVSSGTTVTATPSSSTTYTITETQSGCNSSTTVTVNVTSTLSVSAISSSDSICVGDSAILTASGAANFIWSPSGTLSGSTGSSVTATPTSTTTYMVVGSSGSCMDSATITITVNLLPNVFVNSSNMTVCTGNSAILNANGANSYFWSPVTELNQGTGNFVVATPSSTTIFTVIGTNANGCSNSDSITISVIPAPVVTVTPASASICKGDSTMLSASGNVSSYDWLPVEGLSSFSDSVIFASPDSSIVYTVSGTDDNGCTGFASVAVSLYSEITSIVTVIDATCNADDGKAIISASGGTSPFTYLWNDEKSQANAVANALIPGSYTVTITDSNGCTSSVSATVNLLSALTVSITSEGAVCGINDGMATVAASGGPLPYSYLWNNEMQTQSIVFLEAGNYSVTVTDSSGCKRIMSAEVGTKQPSVSKYVVKESCKDKGDGAVSVTVSGGVLPYSYSWSNGASAKDISELNEGIYVLKVTDSIGCEITDSSLVELLSQNCLNIPKGFTPNGDGKNDVWRIRGVEEFPEINIEIFNRWGTKVFSSKGYKEPWDGDGLPAAAYYYIITFGDGTSETGTVTIVR